MSFIMTAFWNTPKIKGYFGMLGGKIKVKTYTTIQKTILIVDFDTIILRADMPLTTAHGSRKRSTPLPFEIIFFRFNYSIYDIYLAGLCRGPP